MVGMGCGLMAGMGCGLMAGMGCGLMTGMGCLMAVMGYPIGIGYMIFGCRIHPSVGPGSCGGPRTPVGCPRIVVGCPKEGTTVGCPGVEGSVVV